MNGTAPLRGTNESLPALRSNPTWIHSSLPREFSPHSVEPQSVYLIQLGPADRKLAQRRLETFYTESGRDQWQLINPHIELLVNQSGTVVQAFLLATTNVDTFVREWTNTVSRGGVPARFYQLVPPLAGQNVNQ